MSVIVRDKMPAFKRSAFNALDDALAEGAREILIKAKTKAPYNESGVLRSESLIDKITPLHHRIEFNADYARFQEFGGDGKRIVRNYTTSGTGAHYLKDAGDNVVNRMNQIFIIYSKRVRV